MAFRKDDRDWWQLDIAYHKLIGRDDRLSRALSRVQHGVGCVLGVPMEKRSFPFHKQRIVSGEPMTIRGHR